MPLLENYVNITHYIFVKFILRLVFEEKFGKYSICPAMGE
jgi:hypothetical protein